jgi:hypothetical protein
MGDVEMNDNYDEEYNPYSRDEDGEILIDADHYDELKGYPTEEDREGCY